MLKGEELPDTRSSDLKDPRDSHDEQDVTMLEDPDHRIRKQDRIDERQVTPEKLYAVVMRQRIAAPARQRLNAVYVTPVERPCDDASDSKVTVARKVGVQSVLARRRDLEEDELRASYFEERVALNDNPADNVGHEVVGRDFTSAHAA